jgi:hypothetical protein
LNALDVDHASVENHAISDNPSVHASRIDSAADAVAERPYNQRSQSRIAGPTNVVIELH